jgi:hypothetical protein
MTGRTAWKTMRGASEPDRSAAISAADSVGALELLDLDIISEYDGRETLPYPFRYTQPQRFATEDEVAAYARTVPDRLRHADLRPFKVALNAYATADVWVDCHVQQIRQDTPSARVLAYRKGNRGFVCVQRPDADVVDIDCVSPYELGAAICDAVSLTKPGRHPSVIVPEYGKPPQKDWEVDAFTVKHQVSTPLEVTVAESEISSYAIVQSHHQLVRRRWGPDPERPSVVWIQVADDGDYIYRPEHSAAQPLTASILRDQIDKMIASDVALLRARRRDSQ